MRALIVEDDGKVAGALRAGLTAEGYEAVVARTGEDGYFRARLKRQGRRESKHGGALCER